ncbi:MAG: tetratricopeptide repeat protein [Planctomycetota bacterium]|jgi:serine/threonine protein kinase/Flp pilus assembly protein TadD
MTKREDASADRADRIVAVIDRYLADRRAGRAPSREEFLRGHPEIAEDLEVCLEGLELIENVKSDSAPSGDAAASEPPLRELGDFRIVREVGRGGMGVVYEAEQISLRRRVALKMLPLAGAVDAKHLQRFRNEAQAAAHLHHNHIVPVYAVGSDRGVHHYAMQFVDGLSVAEMIDVLRGNGNGGAVRPPSSRSPSSSAAIECVTRGGSTRSERYCRAVARLGAQAAEALDHAHERGVVHRDIKPANLLIDGEGHLWITDFGLAAFSHNAGLTLTGDIVGTVRYMSPEQALAKRVPIDHRTDIYSLGVTLYEFLTLETAYPGDDPRRVIQDLAFKEPTSARRVNPAVPTELETILIKAMAKRADDRYATAEELAADLQRFLEDRPIQARRPGVLKRAEKWARRHRPAVVAAAAVLLLMVAGLVLGAVLLARERDEANRQRELAEKREREAQQVSDFQASMLSGIRVIDMGRSIKQRLREQVRAALERQYVGEFPDRRKRTPQEVGAELAAFDRVADAMNTVGVARRVMDEFVLTPAANALEEQFGDQPLVRVQLHLAIGSSYRRLGLEAEAEPHFRAALKDRRRVLGDEHPDTLRSLMAMGDLLVDRRPAEAELYYREALESRRRVLGDEHWDTVIPIHYLGYALHEQGKLTDAEPYFLEALEKFRRIVGNENPLTLTALHNFGRLLHAQGRLIDAESCYREVLESRPGWLVTLNNLGTVLRDQGRLAEAERCCVEVLTELRSNVPDHPNRMKSINNMGVLLQRQGNLPEAEAHFREALNGLLRVRGDEDPATLKAMHNLGSVLRAQGKTDEAEPYCRAAMDTRRRVRGNGHPDTLLSIDNMGKLLRAQGKLAEADSLLASATRAARAGLGSHPITAMTENHHAELLLELGRVDEAIDLARTAVDRYRANPDWPPDEAASARRVLAATLSAAGRQREPR